MQLHPSILPADFDITPAGELVLNLPDQQQQIFPHQQQPQLEVQQEEPEEKLPTTQNGYSTMPQAATTAAATAENATVPTARPSNLLNNSNINDPLFHQVVMGAAQGREVKYINLYKPDGSSLGFSVVGLKSEHKGELGIYVQEIQPHGIAAQDGRLMEGDQILAIDGQPLESNISHQQAIGILQRAKGTVDLVVARHKDEDQQQNTSSNKQLPANVMNSDW